MAVIRLNTDGTIHLNDIGDVAVDAECCCNALYELCEPVSIEYMECNSSATIFVDPAVPSVLSSIDPPPAVIEIAGTCYEYIQKSLLAIDTFSIDSEQTDCEAEACAAGLDCGDPGCTNQITHSSIAPFFTEAACLAALPPSPDCTSDCTGSFGTSPCGAFCADLGGVWAITCCCENAPIECNSCHLTKPLKFAYNITFTNSTGTCAADDGTYEVVYKPGLGLCNWESAVVGSVPGPFGPGTLRLEAGFFGWEVFFDDGGGFYACGDKVYIDNCTPEGNYNDTLGCGGGYTCVVSNV